MSIADFKSEIKESVRQQKIELKNLIKKLPNSETDDPETQLVWAMNKGWSQTIEDSLEKAGYDVTFRRENAYQTSCFIISFSDDVKEKMKGDDDQELRFQEKVGRDRKRRIV